MFNMPRRWSSQRPALFVSSRPPSRRSSKIIRNRLFTIDSGVFPVAPESFRVRYARREPGDFFVGVAASDASTRATVLHGIGWLTTRTRPLTIA